MIKVGSDFSGVGAFNQALMRLDIDYEEIFACDMDKYARQTFIHNYGEPKYFPYDVYEREIPTESLDIYMTSPPCQAFSLSGKRLGVSEERGILFYNSLEFIKKNKPRYFIFENVKGLLSSEKGETFKNWLELLGGKSINNTPTLFKNEDSVDYHIYWKILNAKKYGVPQNRERVFIIGIRDDEDNNFEFPNEVPLEKKLRDVLEENVDDKYYLSNKMLELLTYKRKGSVEIANINKGGQKGSVADENGEYIGCLSATDYKLPKLIQVKSATSKGYEEATEGDSINFTQPNSKTRRGRVGKQVAQTLDTGCSQSVVIAAIRGRESEDGWKQQLEIGSEEASNSLTTAQKDNVLVYDYKRFNDTIEKHELTEGETTLIDSYNKSVHKDVSPTITTRINRSNHTHLWDGYEIRKLTPRECFRLMDFPDTFTWPVSNTQAYKQAGNSIVVNVLYNILKNLRL